MVHTLRQLATIELRPTEIGFDKVVENTAGQEDRDVGICAVPMYAFTGDEMELINSGTDLGRIQDILRAKNVFQYFFPSPDHLALGLVDRRKPASEEQLSELMPTAPQLGHPYSAMEILPRETGLSEVIDALRDRKLIVEGEVGYEVTEAGESTRATVKFQSREGLVSKLINRFELRINLKSLFKL
jgi:hypothetical protein